MKDRHYNSQIENDKGTNIDLQNSTNKTKDWATQTLLTTGANSSAPEGYAVSVLLVAPVIQFYSKSSFYKLGNLVTRVQTAGCGIEQHSISSGIKSYHEIARKIPKR